MEAFVYCWTDKSNNKLYVGIHKGTADDGYVSSGRLFMEEYNSRPNDFTRQIIAHGTWADCYALETAILKSVDARDNPQYYNQFNNDGNWGRAGIFTPEIKEKMSKSRIGLKHSEETKAKIGRAHKGKIISEETKEKWRNKMVGRTLSAEHKAAIGQSHIGRKNTPETIEKMRLAAYSRKPRKVTS
jgi:NUMOD3 motif